MRRSAADRGAGMLQRFDAALKALQFAPSCDWAIAVSGGGDSIALMHLAADWSSAHGANLPIVLTVDHGLRPQSDLEAARVQQTARGLGLTANVLCWRGPKPRSGIEDKARTARYRLMGDWCTENGIARLMLGHT